MYKSVVIPTVFLLITVSIVFGQHVESNANMNSVYVNNSKINVWKNRSGTHSKITLTNSTSSFFPLTIQADFIMSYLYVYNDAGEDTIIQVENSIATILLPAGLYGFITGYFPTSNQEVLITKDSLNLNVPIYIPIYGQEANHTLQFELVRETGISMYVSTLSFYFTSRFKETGLTTVNFGTGTAPFFLKYNYMPGNFDKEWAAKGKQLYNGGNLYLISGELFSLRSDSIIHNDPVNLARADFYYHFPDSVEARGSIQIFTLFPDFHTWGYGDVFYSHPVHLTVFQDTTSELSLLSSIFIQHIHADNLAPLGYIWTPELRIKKNKVSGFFHYDHQISFTVSEVPDSVQIGLTPAYWFGKFVNCSDTIKIRSPYGRFIHLFLSQSNDILRHYDVDYRLFRNNLLIKKGNFPTWSPAPLLFIGFNPDSLTIPVPTDSSYEIIITDNHYQLDGQEGISRVNAQFDLTQNDKDPPNIVLFQILDPNNILANKIAPRSGYKVRLIIEDESFVNKIQLFYSPLHDSSWVEIPLEQNIPYWLGEIPILPTGFYSFRLVCKDIFENMIETLMKPGFHIEDLTEISEDSVSNEPGKGNSQLLSCYPNPFNSTILIPVHIHNAIKENIMLEVIDILGQEIKTLFKGRLFPGNHLFKWNGTNQDGKKMASGIYFILLKGGDELYNQKVILIR